jgi:hypothetical protein
MTELKERFSLADEIGTRDLWGEARRRSAAIDHPSTGAAFLERRLGWRRLGTGVVAFAVFAAAAVFGWDAFHTDVQPPPPLEAPPPVDLAAELPEGWSELPAPPEVRSGSATAWTGSHLLVWGGYVFDGSGNKSPWDDGFTFDAASRTWSRVPDGPLSGRSDAAVAWTGEELLIWGGFTGDCCEPSEMFLSDGAAYDPVARRWRVLPPAPIAERAPFSVWTGRELVVWGSRGRELYLRDGAAYDPAADTWRRIADAPWELSDATSIWTGEEMIVFGSSLDGNNRSQTPTAVGLAYDPAQDRWRAIPPSQLSPQAHTAGWPGTGEMIAWDYEHGSAAYDPATDTWRRFGDVPLRFYECHPQSATISNSMFGEFCGALTVFSGAEDRWRRITRDDLRGWLIEPVAAGSAFLVMAHSLELSEEPGVTFDTRMLAYVPKDADTTGDVRNPTPLVPSTETNGATVRIPLVFPDGSEVTLVYPVGLRLAELGIQPEVSYLWREYPPPRFPIVFLHDPQASIAEYVDETEPIDYVSSGPAVEIWEMSEEWSNRRRLPQGLWLSYRLRSWTVLAAVEGLEQVEKVLSSLEIRETRAGFPIVEASGPIALSTESGEGEGSMLAVGTTLDPSVFLWLEQCEGAGGTEASGAYGSACLAGGRISANIYGDPSTVEAIVDGLRAEGFVPAPGS